MACGFSARDAPAGIQVAEPVDVAQQRLGVRQQRVSQQNRLRRLRVRLARHDCVRMAFRLLDDGPNQVRYLHGDIANRVAHPHSEEGGNLIVPGATGTQPPTDLRADPLDESALHRTVDILVRRPRGKVS